MYVYIRVLEELARARAGTVCIPYCTGWVADHVRVRLCILPTPPLKGKGKRKRGKGKRGKNLVFGMDGLG